MWDATTILLAAVGVLFIGLAKAGFGGALGMLTTPICIVAFGAHGKGPAFALGVVLPLLCAGDLFALYHYWGKWERKNLRVLLPGVVAGVALRAMMIDRFTPRQLNFCIGLIAIAFVLFQVARKKFDVLAGRLHPTATTGLPFGVAAGVTSTFAHGAGPVVSIFLMAQHLPKEIFMGTQVLVFTWVNWIKLPFFAGTGIITRETVVTGLWFLPVIPVGIWLGLWMNRKLSEAMFLKVAYAVLFLAGLYLVFDVKPGTWFRS